VVADKVQKKRNFNTRTLTEVDVIIASFSCLPNSIRRPVSALALSLMRKCNFSSRRTKGRKRSRTAIVSLGANAFEPSEFQQGQFDVEHFKIDGGSRSSLLSFDQPLPFPPFAPGPDSNESLSNRPALLNPLRTTSQLNPFL